MVFIIAEAGVNHNGNIDLARKLIDVAAQAGVDAVKFQTWKTELLVTPEAEMADYQVQNTGQRNSQFEMLKKLELSYADFSALKSYCDERGVMFMSTPDELESADFLNSLQSIFKISSGDLTNIMFLRKIASYKKDVIISTGMGTMEVIAIALDTLVTAGLDKQQITVLHANTEYPTPMQDVNLLAMVSIKDTLGVKAGYSDHTLGIEVPIAAAALGAAVIEKHFTLSRTMEGPDHKASLEPQELQAMVKAIRNIEMALGDGQKKVSASEMKNVAIARKSIVAGQEIKAGEIYTAQNLTIKRPGTGISPLQWDKVIGQIARKEYHKDEMIEL
ncbi:MAG: N-acetylneuraminate synthase [Candidatus Margulisbacteria bacterium]|nr:N-acetylneuraminate synthase [Candidatus Margulisiibacteriota bacterium]